MKNLKNLGHMNSWNQGQLPTPYTTHLENCGNERIATLYHGDPNAPTQEVVRDYNMNIENLGTCYNKHTCNDCGITYSIDSTD